MIELSEATLEQIALELSGRGLEFVLIAIERAGAEDYRAKLLAYADDMTPDEARSLFLRGADFVTQIDPGESDRNIF